MGEFGITYFIYLCCIFDIFASTFFLCTFFPLVFFVWFSLFFSSFYCFSFVLICTSLSRWLLSVLGMTPVTGDVFSAFPWLRVMFIFELVSFSLLCSSSGSLEFLLTQISGGGRLGNRERSLCLGAGCPLEDSTSEQELFPQHQPQLVLRGHTCTTLHWASPSGPYLRRARHAPSHSYCI